MTDRIFISHSLKDIKFVETFVDSILKLGLEISHERIFCSSMEGHGVRSGEYIPDRLKEEVKKSCLAILFISNNYKQSEVCLNEVGAVWVTLEKARIIPLLLPEIEFNKLGFLDFGRQGLKIDKSEHIYKLIQDNRHELNPDFNLELVNHHIKEFLVKIENYKMVDGNSISIDEQSLERSEFYDCFEENLFPYNEVLRRSIPTLAPGIHSITDRRQKNELFNNLSKASFLNHLWYRHSGGDYYVDSLEKLSSENWLIGNVWEVKIEDVWIGLGYEPQNDFILIRSIGLPPFKYQSDIGGEGYSAGVLNNGIIVSENEDSNGFAVLDGVTIRLADKESSSRYRDSESRWIFLITDYHRIGFNSDETIAFCKKLDKGEIVVSADSLGEYLMSLRNHPTVLIHR